MPSATGASAACRRPETSLDAGTVVAGYRVEGLLGRGGMGVVYEATQLSLNRKVALKLLGAELGGDPAFTARLRREAELQAALDHPHVVTVHEAGESEAGFFSSRCALIRGQTLKARCREGHRSAGPTGASERDADRDGFGDGSQDRCPGRAGQSAGCP